MDIKRLIDNIRYNLHFKSIARGDFCREKGLFKGIGNNVRLPFMTLPLYPQLVVFHNNIEVASGVKFITHDAIHGVLNNTPVAQKIVGGGRQIQGRKI